MPFDDKRPINQVILYDADGNAIDTFVCAGDRYLDAAVVQNASDSTSNSSTTNLAGGASFTGTAESTLGAAAIRVNCIADQPLKVEVQQSEDGTNWDISDERTQRAGEVSGRVFMATSAFFRVVVTNTSSTLTTFHRTTSILLPIGNPLPRALTRLGNLKIALVDDQHEGKETQFSAFGLLKTAQESLLGDYRFDAVSVPGRFDVVTTGTGGFSIPTGGTGVKLSTGASSSSKIELQSKIIHAYKSGRGHMLKQSIITHDVGVVGNVREWGFKTGDNGLFVRLGGTTLEWVILTNGVELTIDSSDWDIPVTPDRFGHLWYVQLEWLGVGDIFLYYDERIVHTHRFTGTSEDFSVGTPDLAVWYRNENISNATDVALTSGCASVVMEGGTLISGVDPDGTTREVGVDSAGNLKVVFTASAETLIVNPNFERSDGAIAANAYKRVIEYTIPFGFNGWLIRFSSFQNETAKSRLVAFKDLGTYEFVTNNFVADETYIDPQWSSVIEAEVTTETSAAGSSPITVTVTYTNDTGASGRTGTFSIPKSSIVGSRFKMTLQTGDIGLQSIQSVSDDSPNAGAILIRGNLQLAYHNDLSSTIQLETNYQPGAIAFASGTKLAVEYEGGIVSKDRLFDMLIQLVKEII